MVEQSGKPTETEDGSFLQAQALQRFELHDPSNLELSSPEELSTEAIEAIAAKFGYYTEVDQDGLTRQIYKYNGVGFSFAGREETPVYPSMQASRPTRLGREAWWLNHEPNQAAPEIGESEAEYYRESGYTEAMIDQLNSDRFKEWDNERQRLTNYEPTLAGLRNKNTGQPEHFIAEESPYGVYSLLSKLQPENTHWRTQAEDIMQNKYNEEALVLIDMITAINAYYIEQDPNAQHQPPIGEIVAVASLLGDNAALSIAEKAVKLQRDKEQAAVTDARESIIKTERPTDVEPFKPSDLVIVHATKYEPSETVDGFKILTTHDASGFPRATIHTSINHKVESHMWGAWDDSDYVVVAGLDRALEANGTPKSLNGADTWWTRNPGEPLILPGATLIMPGGNQDVLMTDTEHGRRKYKSKGLTQEDIERADDIRPGLAAHITAALHNEEGSVISVDTMDGQKIVANILRDVLVQQEISIARGLKIEVQDDDKFMPAEFNQKIYKMAADLRLPLMGALHADSDESHIENYASRGKQVFSTPDPKVRRVAYASGFISTGGDARLNYLKRMKDPSPAL